MPQMSKSPGHCAHGGQVPLLPRQPAAVTAAGHRTDLVPTSPLVLQRKVGFYGLMGLNMIS